MSAIGISISINIKHNIGFGMDLEKGISICEKLSPQIDVHWCNQLLDRKTLILSILNCYPKSNYYARVIIGWVIRLSG